MTRLFLHIFLLSCLALAACGQGVSELMTEGDQYLKDGNYQGAIVIYKTVLENAPETMEARLALAKAYLGAGKMEQAEKNFEKYQRQNPYDKSVLLDMAKVSTYRKNNQAAIDHLTSYIKEYPESAEAYELLGRNYWVQNQKPKTKASFEKAIELDPEGTSAQFSLVQYYLATGDKKTADSLIESILAKNPDQQDALHYVARDQLSTGKLEAYQETLNRLLTVYPDDSYAKYSLAKSYITQRDESRALQLANELKMEAPRTGFGQKAEGLVYYSKKEYKDAIDSFLEAVSIRPDVESYMHLGLSQYGAGDLETAISNLRVAADRAPKLVKAREMISLILFQQQRYNEAIAEAEKVLEVDPNNVVARVIKGDAYSAKGDAKSALEQLKEITEKDPQYAAAFLKMGALHYAQGDMAASEAALKGAIEAAPETVRPRLVLSNFYMRSGKKDLARKTLEEGLTGKPDDVTFYTYLARMELAERRPAKAKELLAKGKSADETNPATYMMLASIYLAEKKPEAALEEYDSLLQHREGYLRALLGKAVILDTLERSTEADAVYQESTKTGHPNAFMAYASSKRKSGDVEGSYAIIQSGLEKNPNHGALLKSKAEVLFALKRFDEVFLMCDEIEKVSRTAGLSLRVRAYMVMEDYEKAIATGRQMCDFAPKDPTGYLVLGEVYKSLKRADDWGNILQEGVAKCGPNFGLLLELSKFYASAGDFNKALTYLDSVIKSNDKSPRAHSMQGDIYMQLGRNGKAVKSYNKALELNDKYVPALNNLAMIYLDDSKTASEALRLAYKAYLQVPWNASVMDTFGYALAVNGKKEASVSILEKAVAVESDNPVINYHLGYAYHKAGKKEQAIEKLKMVADCADCDNADDARKLLKTIK